MSKYFDGEFLSGFEESPKTTTSRYEQWGYESYRDTQTSFIASNYVEVMNEQATKIAALETKLAERERKANKTNEENYQLYLKLNQFYSRLGVEAYLYDEIQDVAIKELNKLLTNTKKQYLKEISELKQQLTETDKLMQEYLSKCLSLEQQLAEKDQAIEGLQEINQSLGQTCNNDAKEIERLREELHIANQETLHFQNKYFAENQTAIEKLEKVKELIKEHYNNQFPDFPLGVTEQIHIGIIDQQIRVLKGEK